MAHRLVTLSLLAVGLFHGCLSMEFLHVWPMGWGTCGFDVKTGTDALQPTVDSCGIPLGAQQTDLFYPSLYLSGRPFLDLPVKVLQEGSDFTFTVNVRPAVLNGTLLHYTASGCSRCLTELIAELQSTGKVAITASTDTLGPATKVITEVTLTASTWNFLSIAFDVSLPQIRLTRYEDARTRKFGDFILTTDYLLFLTGSGGQLRIGQRFDGSGGFRGDVTCVTVALEDREVKYLEGLEGCLSQWPQMPPVVYTGGASQPPHLWPLGNVTCAYDVSAPMDAIFPHMDDCRTVGDPHPQLDYASLRLGGDQGPLVELLVNATPPTDGKFSLALNVKPDRLSGVMLDFTGVTGYACIDKLTVRLLETGHLEISVNVNGQHFTMAKAVSDSLPALEVNKWFFLSLGFEKDKMLVTVNSVKKDVNLSFVTTGLGTPGYLTLGSTVCGSNFAGDITCAAYFQTLEPTSSTLIEACDKPWSFVMRSPTFRSSFVHVLRMNNSQTGYDVISGRDIRSRNSSLLIDTNVTPVGPGSVLWNGSTSALEIALDRRAFDTNSTLAFYVALGMNAGRLASVVLATDSQKTTVTINVTQSGLQLQVSSVPNSACPDVVAQLNLPSSQIWSTLLLARTDTSVSLSHSSDGVTALHNCLPSTSDSVTSIAVTIGDDQSPASIRVACFVAHHSVYALLPKAIEEQCRLPKARKADSCDTSTISSSHLDLTSTAASSSSAYSSSKMLTSEAQYSTQGAASASPDTTSTVSGTSSASYSTKDSNDMESVTTEPALAYIQSTEIWISSEVFTTSDSNDFRSSTESTSTNLQSSGTWRSSEVYTTIDSNDLESFTMESTSTDSPATESWRPSNEISESADSLSTDAWTPSKPPVVNGTSYLESSTLAYMESTDLYINDPSTTTEFSSTDISTLLERELALESSLSSSFHRPESTDVTDMNSALQFSFSEISSTDAAPETRDGTILIIESSQASLLFTSEMMTSFFDSPTDSYAPSIETISSHKISPSFTEDTSISSVTKVYSDQTPDANQVAVSRKCRCPCSGRTDLELATSSLVQELTLNKSSLSATRRKLTSMPDPRLSSMAMGTTGVAFLALTLLCLLLCDLTSFCQRRQHKKNEDREK